MDRNERPEENVVYFGNSNVDLGCKQRVWEEATIFRRRLQTPAEQESTPTVDD